MLYFELPGKSAPVAFLVKNDFLHQGNQGILVGCAASRHHIFLLFPDKQSNNASLETLLALLQAEGAKIEEDTEVRLGSLSGIAQAAHLDS